MAEKKPKRKRKSYTRPKDISRYSLAQRLRLGLKPEFQSDIDMQRKSLPIEERINLGSSRTRGINIAGKYAGSGGSGIPKDKIERADARRELVKDRELIKKYGKDAMKARSFNTVRDYAGEGMKKGGKVRGAGIAKQGVRKCKMV